MNEFNILLVDDVEENNYCLKLVIEDSFKHINILTASSAKEAILKIMKYDIDLILSDVQMPEVDGFEFIDYLQGIEHTKDIPIILITGIYNDNIYAKQAYKTGAIDYITKPVDDELLCSKLRVYINIFENRKQDKELIIEKNKEILNQVKINSMLNNLEEFSPKMKKDLSSLNILESEDNSIDILSILKNV